MVLSLLAVVTLHSLFSDNAVLQQNAAVPVWGSAEPQEKITVKFAGQSVTATAVADGRWMATLKPLKRGGPFDLTVQGQNTITATNILVGEVWICSGQSNMARKMIQVENGEQETAAANHPQIRLFFGGWKLADTPQRDIKGAWRVCAPDSVQEFSAVAFYFGRELQKSVHVPVGLVQVACDWTPSEAWTSREALASDPDIKQHILDRWDQLVAEYPAKKKAFDEKRLGKEPPNPDFIHRATALWNGGIAPLIPFAMRGVLWYQGETNDSRAHQYRKLFPMLIRDWRRAWKQEFPFLFVQLSTVGPAQTEPAVSDWAELRESQLMALCEPHTAMAVTIDIGDGDVHPKNKKDVGARLALAARALAYGQKIEYSGPVFDSAKVDGSVMRLLFKHAGGGLVAKDGTLKGFAIAGDDRTFVAADARIENDAVAVTSEKIAKPVAVRYAWANNPVCNLCNKAGLPASPFRTDDWPGNTFGKTKMWIEEAAE